MPQPAATHLVGISFKFSKDFEGLSTRLASKQRENAETEIRRVLVLTSYTASPMPLKRGWNQYGRIFVEFSVFRPAIENRGFKQIKKFLRRFTQHNMQIYLSEKKIWGLGAL